MILHADLLGWPQETMAEEGSKLQIWLPQNPCSLALDVRFCRWDFSPNGVRYECQAIVVHRTPGRSVPGRFRAGRVFHLYMLEGTIMLECLCSHLVSVVIVNSLCCQSSATIIIWLVREHWPRFVTIHSTFLDSLPSTSRGLMTPVQPNASRTAGSRPKRISIGHDAVTERESFVRRSYHNTRMHCESITTKS